ncbi:MAG: hypothetical protein ACR2LN_05675 [Candidatus Levyibacteriota bacterium]
MDPKALDHLDPKQKEAYERIMGHATASDDSASTSSPSLSTDPTAVTLPEPTPVTDFNSAPLDNSLNAPDPNAPQFYTPGQDQSANDTNPPLSATPESVSSGSTSFPQESPTAFDVNTLGSSEINPPSGQPQENLTPPNSSFFSNASPAETMPSANEALSTPLSPPTNEIPASSPDDFASTTPITPYTPGETPDFAPMTEPFTKPLPPPASVNQENTQQSSPLLRVLYIVGAVVFFGIYSIFWIKVFNLPFLF